MQAQIPSTTNADAGLNPERSQADQKDQRGLIIGVSIGVLLILAALIGGLIYLGTTDLDNVSRIRDMFIIFMALESLLLMLVLVILIIQIARLINLINNEIKPILQSTNETVSTLRGTTNFLSENMVEPVIKLNEYLAGLSGLLGVIGMTRRNNRKNK